MQYDSSKVLHLTGHYGPYPVYDVELPPARMGGKCFMVEEKGVYVLHKGPGVLRSIACTHVGVGAVDIYDGVPSGDGFFPPCGSESVNYLTANGRRLYSANPQTMCLWMLEAGFRHGLTVRCIGGTAGVPVFLSIVWMTA